MAKTMKIVSLNRCREHRERREKHEVKASLVHHARNASDDIDGYGLVMFKHNPDGTYTSRTRFFVHDATDAPRLPELARHCLDLSIKPDADV